MYALTAFQLHCGGFTAGGAACFTALRGSRTRSNRMRGLRLRCSNVFVGAVALLLGFVIHLVSLPLLVAFHGGVCWPSDEFQAYQPKFG